jgi:glycosyltransferase involved in cell wall biosynthesis
LKIAALKIRIAIVVSHPIQHFCPQYVSFAEQENVELEVFFASTLGHKSYKDAAFKIDIAWDNLNLDKFPHDFLNGDQLILPNKHIDAPSLNGKLEEFSPDLVITYGYYQRLQRRAHKWANKNNVPLAYISDSELKQKRNLLKELIKYPFLYRYFSTIQYFLSVGDSNELYYKKYGVGSNRILRMHFPIDLKYYQAAFANKGKLRNEIRTEYKITENDIVLSVVGKLDPTKNHAHLIEALLEMEKRNLSMSLFIIGSGTMEDDLKRKTAQLSKCTIHFTGFVPVGKLPAFYAATDIYVHPSFADRHPIAVSEAIFMGCPVIISDTCGSHGPDDDVQDGKNGYVYEFGNIDQLAEKIIDLANDPEKRSMQGQYSHEIGARFQENAHRGIIQKLVNSLPLRNKSKL